MEIESTKLSDLLKNALKNPKRILAYKLVALLFLFLLTLNLMLYFSQDKLNFITYIKENLFFLLYSQCYYYLLLKLKS